MADAEPESTTTPSLKTLQLLSALQLKGIGVAAVRKWASLLLDRPELSVEELATQPGRNAATSTEVKLAHQKANDIVERCLKQNISVFSLADHQYPSRLRTIKDAPPILYVKGSVTALQVSGCAVVGTRHASKAGLEIARRIATTLVEHGYSVISGLALGIDAAGHRGALDAKGITVAIMAHGLDTVAPTSHKKLADQILDSGGSLVAEHEPGIPPRPAEFVRRNRIQSGMSICSIIVESGEVGGSIHQARFTKEQGRPVLAALPNFPHSAHSGFNPEGGEFLVRTMGAIRLERAEQLHEFLPTFVRQDSKPKSLGL